MKKITFPKKFSKFSSLSKDENLQFDQAKNDLFESLDEFLLSDWKENLFFDYSDDFVSLKLGGIGYGCNPVFRAKRGLEFSLDKKKDAILAAYNSYVSEKTAKDDARAKEIESAKIVGDTITGMKNPIPCCVFAHTTTKIKIGFPKDKDRWILKFWFFLDRRNRNEISVFAQSETVNTVESAQKALDLFKEYEAKAWRVFNEISKVLPDSFWLDTKD